MLPIPTKIFVRGIEHLFAPAVENHDFKIRNLVPTPLRKGKEIIQTIGLGRSNHIGKIQFDLLNTNDN